MNSASSVHSELNVHLNANMLNKCSFNFIRSLLYRVGFSHGMLMYNRFLKHFQGVKSFRNTPAEKPRYRRMVLIPRLSPW